jgi:hypothetical protein
MPVAMPVHSPIRHAESGGGISSVVVVYTTQGAAVSIARTVSGGAAGAAEALHTASRRSRVSASLVASRAAPKPIQTLVNSRVRSCPAFAGGLDEAETPRAQTQIVLASAAMPTFAASPMVSTRLAPRGDLTNAGSSLRLSVTEALSRPPVAPRARARESHGREAAGVDIEARADRRSRTGSESTRVGIDDRVPD